MSVAEVCLCLQGQTCQQQVVEVVTGKGDGSVCRAVAQRLQMLKDKMTLVEDYNGDAVGDGAIRIFFRKPGPLRR